MIRPLTQNLVFSMVILFWLSGCGGSGGGSSFDGGGIAPGASSGAFFEGGSSSGGGGSGGSGQPVHNPEPTSLLLLGSGLAGLAFSRRFLRR